MANINVEQKYQAIKESADRRIAKITDRIGSKVISTSTHTILVNYVVTVQKPAPIGMTTPTVVVDRDADGYIINERVVNTPVKFIEETVRLGIVNNEINAIHDEAEKEFNDVEAGPSIAIITDNTDYWFNEGKFYIAEDFGIASNRVKVYNWMNQQTKGATYWKHWFNHSNTTIANIIDLGDESLLQLRAKYATKYAGSTYSKMYNYLLAMENKKAELYYMNRTTNEINKANCITDAIGKYEVNVENSSYLYNKKHEVLTRPMSGTFYYPITTAKAAESFIFYLENHGHKVVTDFKVFNHSKAPIFSLIDMEKNKNITASEVDALRKQYHEYIVNNAVEATPQALETIAEEYKNMWANEEAQRLVEEVQYTINELEELGKADMTTFDAGYARIIRSYFDIDALNNNDTITSLTYQYTRKYNVEALLRHNLPNTSLLEYITDLDALKYNICEAFRVYKIMKQQQRIKSVGQRESIMDAMVNDEYNFGDDVVIEIQDNDEVEDVTEDTDDIEVRIVDDFADIKDIFDTARENGKTITNQLEIEAEVHEKLYGPSVVSLLPVAYKIEEHAHITAKKSYAEASDIDAIVDAEIGEVTTDLKTEVMIKLYGRRKRYSKGITIPQTEENYYTKLLKSDNLWSTMAKHATGYSVK